MKSVFIKLSSFFWALFFIGLALDISAVSAQNPSLRDIDLLYEKNQSEEDLKKISAQIENVLGTHPNQPEWHWRLARTHYALAKKVEESKSHHFDLCILHSSRTIEMKSDSAIGYFYRALCRGKQGEMNGIWASLGIIGPFEKDMKKALELDPLVSHAGPHRALGKLYLELPFILGGDLDKSSHHLQEAVKLAPEYAENHLGLAQVLIEQKNATGARESLHNLLQLTDNTQDEELLSLRKQGLELLEKLSL